VIELGFISSALAGRPLRDIALWGKAHGLAFLEVGPHAPLDEVRQYLENPVLPVRALLYCRNLRHPDSVQRQEFLEKTEARLDLAREYGVPIVNLSTGIDPAKSLRANVEASAEVLRRLCERTGDAVTVAVENCPDTSNIAVNPDIWEMLLDEVAMPNFKLTYDPSHLLRLLIEPYEPLYEFAPHIVHVHAKDTEVNWARLRRRGFLDDGWWRYRVPGWGQLDWRALLTRLVEVGFTGGISLEHEDPLFGGHHDGRTPTPAEAEAGLLAGAAHLKPLLAQVYGGESWNEVKGSADDSDEAKFRE
jgi:sugar phosphate isomerase/epimerase